jgi:hypothetical protein
MRSWRQKLMSENTGTHPDGSVLRLEIKECIQRHDSVTVAEIVTEVGRDNGCPEALVVEQLDEMEQHGFVYLIGEGSSAEVKLP